MPDMEPIPYDRVSQRAVSRNWDATVEGRVIDHPVSIASTRALVHESWQRSVHAAVPADLPKAPLVLSDGSLHDARERADWVPLALKAAQHLTDAFTNGHILSLFDAEGRMLSCDGDPAVLEGLAAINFRPGGLWTESAVGTNGPGTALHTRRAVHIVGAEHFCQAWHGWHCAAVPVADAVTNDLLGVIDISGFSRHAHPHTLQLAISLASSVREMLAARDMEYRCAVLQRFAQLSSRYAQDPLIAVDRRGVVLHASESAPAGLRPDSDTPRALRHAIATHVNGFATHGALTESTDVFLSLAGEQRQEIGVAALSFPVYHGTRVVGACLLLRSGATVRTGSIAAPTSIPTTVASASSVRAISATRHDDVPFTTNGRAARIGAALPARNAAATRYTLRDIVGSTPRIRDAVRMATAAARTAMPVLLLGESGTGKEVFAQAIHEASDRRGRPFVAVNCAALPRELIESELFGHVNGAFTGARREGSPGKFRAADGGTIFLDEISEMPLSAQATLLRVLQEQEVSAVGSSDVHALNVRVLAATNRDVADALRAGRLRADLYYRLNVLTIELPSLRDRRADIPVLAAHLLSLAAQELARPGLHFAPTVLPVLAEHDWPGNVRELKNLVRRAAALSTSDRLTLDQFQSAMPALSAAPVQANGCGADTIARALSGGEASERDASSGNAFHRDALERARTVEAMQGSRTMHDAARRLGINRSTLYRRLERFGLTSSRLLQAQ